MRPVVCQVSDYCADIIAQQYTAHLRMIGNCLVTQNPYSASHAIVKKFAANGSHRVVCTSDWSCNCMQFVTSELPCRHVIFVSRVFFQHQFLPLEALRTRWMLTAAVSMLQDLDVCATELQSLRTGLLLVDPRGFASPTRLESDENEDSIDEDLAFLSINTSTSKKSHSTVAHVRLTRGEAASGIVLDNLEKRNVVMAEIQPIMSYMIAQSSPRFKSMAVYLREMLDGLLDAFKDIPLTEKDEIEAALSAARARCEASPQEQIRAMVEAALETDHSVTRRAAQDDSSTLDLKHYEIGRVAGGTQSDGLPAVQPPLHAISPATLDALPSSDTRVRGEDADDVSSLSMSCASAILQEAAIQHAQAEHSATNTTADRPNTEPL